MKGSIPYIQPVRWLGLRALENARSISSLVDLSFLRLRNKHPKRLLQFRQYIRTSHSRHANLKLCRRL